VSFEAPYLLVTFQDRSVARLSIDQLDNPYLASVQPDWPGARAHIHEVVVPTPSGEIGVPWDTIRALTDVEFAAHWAEVAGVATRQTGARLRTLREERGLSQSDLAERAGIATATVAAVERGEHPSQIELLHTILAALGGTASDLFAEPNRAGA
jgi:DNA-binding XRE family transcriptional regulator